jgi:PAS domain S-box-containing protein
VPGNPGRAQRLDEAAYLLLAGIQPHSSIAGNILVTNSEPAETSGRFARKIVQPLGRMRDWIARTPTGAFVVVTAAVFAAEHVSVWQLIELLPALKPIDAYLEFLVDICVVLPVLVLAFVLPTARSIRERDATARDLRAARDELEDRVRERTAELEESNRRLREESEQRRRAQTAVELQASLLDAVEQAVVATDREGRILFWNRFAEDLYGWAASEVKGRNFADFPTFAKVDGRMHDLCDQCAKCASWTGEVEAVRRDGSRFSAYMACSRRPGGNGEGKLFLSFDITEWKRAEEALRDSEEKYSSLVENSPTGLFICQDNRLVFVNPKLAQLLDRPRDELVGVDAWSFVHADDRELVKEVARKRGAGEPVADEHECRLVTRTGQVRWVAMRNTLFRFQGEAAILGNVQDVTDRKGMETKLHQLSARLLTIQEEERRRVARDLHDSVGQTLTGIKFMVEAALGGPWPGERRSGMQRLHSLVPTIQDAVEEVRRISTELRPSILDDLGLLPTIAWHVREFEKAHPGLAVEQQLNLTETDVPGSLRVPIFRILQEATNNVAKHSGARHLVIGLDAVEGCLRLRVEDDGVGVDPEAPLVEAGKGGFGLSSMRERTALSGGSFSVRSALAGAGTTIEAEWQLDRLVSG